MGDELKLPMALHIALDFADNPLRHDTLRCPADTIDEVREALVVVAAAYRKLLAARAQGPGPGEAVADGWVMVPREPPVELLVSMAVRQDHGLGVPGYYDQPIFGAENVGHNRRMELALSDMRKLYEEVVGDGFYAPEHAERYRAMIAATPTREA